MQKGLIAGCVVILIILGGCQEKVEPEDIVVERHSELENEKRFTAFLTNVQQGKADKIRITSFTTEGDPIYQDLDFDGSKLKMIVDYTEDKFGSGEIIEMACTAIKETETAERTDYVVEGCSDTDGDYLLLVKW
ncbi:uncharacterized protein DUF4362 [Planomicrobium soli]|uniref:Uncharacterized protein DUF4362 n=1 Tax=Planomicrobium soli TaxID=1176648 RepID=A0A2P8GAP3_9BACL|nr:DUF4362 domain-containing protein [Planomicrobium soli]PSL31057.1 uncharacterized protein DUF4362 [Planomicrobium soli]